MDEREKDLAAAVRDACLRTFAAAYEDAGIQGLCAEGRIEVALEAVKHLSAEELLASGKAPTARHPSRRA